LCIIQARIGRLVSLTFGEAWRATGGGMPYNLGNLIGMALFVVLVVVLIGWLRRKKG
jgi:hypothetical protein